MLITGPSPRADWIWAAIRGSSRRVFAYVRPMTSYLPPAVDTAEASHRHPEHAKGLRRTGLIRVRLGAEAKMGRTDDVGDALASALLRQLDAVTLALRGAAAGAPAKPTRCEPWDVRELAAHLALPATALTNGLVAHRAGQDASVGGEPIPSDATFDEVVAQLVARRAALAEELRLLDPVELARLLPPPADGGLSLPTETLMKLALVELGVHRNDLEAALDLAADLDDDVIDAIAEVVPAWLIFGAEGARRPDREVAFRFAGDRIDIGFSFKPTYGWRLGLGSEDCRITGSDTAVALFLVGRITAHSSSLRIIGDDGLADDFKTFLPGP